MREQRGSFDDLVEIWADDAKRLDAQVHLDKYVELIVTKTDPPIRRDGPQSWSAYVVGLSDHDRSGLIGQQLDLKLPNGQTGRAMMDYNSGALTGAGEAPF